MTSSDLLHFVETGSGPPLLLVHGLMVSGEMFESVTSHLAQRNRLIVPDLRGHGESRRIPPPYTVEQLAADLAGLLEQLSIESVAVLGYSQGGAVAQQFALDYPKRCSRLVLTCTYAFNMATRRERLEGRVVPLLMRTLGMKRFAHLVVSKGEKALDKEHAAWLTGLVERQDAHAMSAAWQAAMAFDSRSRLAEIRCPTLVLAGSDDDAVPIHHAKMLHEGIAGSELKVIEGATHALLWTHRAEFLREVDSFLAAQP